MKWNRLKYRLALPTTAIIFALLAVSIVSDYHLQKAQIEDTLHEQAYILSEQMSAVWDFVSVNQDRINTDADGSYNFKGLHCSIAGTSVGALFTDRTDYVIRYVSKTPRNARNSSDTLETEAIDAFLNDSGLTEYTAFRTMENGLEYYRYVIPLKMSKGCDSCHGQPSGELDVTEYPKEGLSSGDLIGAASISIPSDRYLDDLRENTMFQALLSGAMLAACLLTTYIVSMRYVVRPLEKMETAVRKAGAGDLSTRIDAESIHAHDEMKSLALHFNHTIGELASLHAGLEQKIGERTEQLAEANSMLARQAQELERANQRLQDDNRYKTHYFTMMSHELRTPLTAIHAFIDILKGPSGADEKQRKDIIDKIQINTIALRKLVDNILDSARLEAGAVKFDRQVVDVVDIMNTLAKTLEPLACAKNISLYYYVSEKVPLFMGDEDKLLRLLENLGANAIKYSEEGGIVLFEAYLHQKDDTVRFAVIDSGIGIPEDEQGIVFEKYRQTESAMASPVSGSGLGLALAKEYAELHGGSISLKSKPGEGSTFRVYIPYEPPCFDLGGEE